MLSDAELAATEAIRESAAQCGRVIADTLAPAIDGAAGAMQTFHDTVVVPLERTYQPLYEAAGAPYGPEPDGFWRWVREELTAGHRSP